VLRAVIGLFFASTLFASDTKLELRGHLTGEDRGRWLQVTLFSVESPYKDSTRVSAGGEFRFHSLEPGNYTVAVIGEGWEIRRTVVVSPALADRDGILRTTIPIALTGASGNGNGVVTVQQLMIPKKALEWYADAQKRLAQRDAAGAAHDLQEAVKIAPQYSDAWNALGVISFQCGDDLEAEQLFRRALQADPGSFEAHVNLGGLLLKKGWDGEALVHNMGAVQTRPEDALANAQLGMTYFKRGEFDQAERYLVAAKTADPAHFSQPQLFLAEIYARRGDRNGALQELEELLMIRPDGPGAETIRSLRSRFSYATP
jgi:Tfp pilus assembly protein PilF